MICIRHSGLPVISGSGAGVNVTLAGQCKSGVDYGYRNGGHFSNLQAFSLEVRL